MTIEITSTPPRGLARVFQWQRVKVVLIVCGVIAFLFSFGWKAPYSFLIGHLLFAGLLTLSAFGLFETWPRRLPSWMARWVLQIIGVAVAVPIAMWIGYSVTNAGLNPPWWRDNDRLTGFGTFTFLGMLITPWIAVTALLKQIRDDARKQALIFDLERSEYERNALDVRLRLLQAQVAPHFLFNTLANVRELVSTGSQRAAPVLESLIAYLRAAVPRLDQPASTIAQELELVEAYLNVMQMRMPDRLQFSVQAEDDARALICPPMTLLTLVENAMRHGIDPSEEGGRIDVRVQLLNGRGHAEVADTGMGLARGSSGLGTGLANLRERLQLAFSGDAHVTLREILPHGVRADIDFPVQRISP